MPVSSETSDSVMIIGTIPIIKFTIPGTIPTVAEITSPTARNNLFPIETVHETGVAVPPVDVAFTMRVPASDDPVSNVYEFDVELVVVDCFSTPSTYHLIVYVRLAGSVFAIEIENT